MTPQTLNLLYSIALIIAIVGAGLYQLILLVFHNGATDPKVTDIIVTLIGLLMAFRHAADVKNSNGSSGTNGIVGQNGNAPKKDGK